MEVVSAELGKKVLKYIKGETSFISGLSPSEAVKLPTPIVFNILEEKFGEDFYKSLSLVEKIKSPVFKQTNGTWLKRTNIVGVNVRTIQSFWNVVKYALTLPDIQNSVHLLPIWEPGVVASLYGMSSWNINPEFFSEELFHQVPHFDTPEKQLKVVINILHLMGKTVGMDVIPHTDRFSEQVLANPKCFEWLKREGTIITDHFNDLHFRVEAVIFDYFKKLLPHDMPATRQLFFSNYFSEAERCTLMFGAPENYGERLKKRIALMEHLRTFNFETVPATMGPPYRGIKVNEGAEGLVVDSDGREWREYEIIKPEKFSRVFGPLTRYKLYKNKNDNTDWEIDFTKPIVDTWNYAAQHYAEIQNEFGFDFMRGDMAHVQMRDIVDNISLRVDSNIDGLTTVNEQLPTNNYYDLLGFIKKHIATHVPYFGSFAESFLAPDGEMAYGNEVQHLELSEADIVLGDLQSMVVGEKRFMSEWSRYLEIGNKHSVTPTFTIMTADKDDPRFDEFYRENNVFRLFFGLFYTESPSYMGLGFELRDKHKKPALNEQYTKLYVFKIDAGAKATHGNYQWGKNRDLFYTLNAIKSAADKESVFLKEAHSRWIFPPDATGKRQYVAWLISSHDTTRKLLCFAHFGQKKILKNISIPVNGLFFIADFFTLLNYGLSCEYNEAESSIIVNECGPQMCFILELPE